MSAEHHVIISPGLDGRIGGIQFITRNWPEKYNLYPEVTQIIWKDDKEFGPKLKKITDKIDALTHDGNLVSLVGTSASGSLMLNAFLERRDVVRRVVNVGGFLRKGTESGYRNFDVRSAQSISFRQSVETFEKLEPSLTAQDRKKVLTVHPIWDELVPPDTVVLKGALNKQVAMVEHVLGISTALVIYDPVIAFLKV